MFARTERLGLRRFTVADAEEISQHENLRQPEAGFTGSPAFQDEGNATEAVRGLLERVGFRREGLRPATSWFRGEWTDDLLSGRRRTDYLS
ncbi:hypothetical protein [Kribbella turkmenica]|uniref:hypothetical protein n=1 Tax=Kribbella turkmenica TaxID=2530375 RepID=UPI00192E28AE|nr:hypothetical protein [Kribbella turkmenica]